MNLQVYLHHTFGASSVLLTEGSEMRGMMNSPPLPDPYYIIINGTAMDNILPTSR